MRFIQGPDKLVYRDVRVPLRIGFSDNIADEQLPQRVTCVLHVEDTAGRAVEVVSKGQRLGHTILSQHQFVDVCVSNRHDISLPPVCFREVTRNHRCQFVLVLSLPAFPRISPARSEPFTVKSKRCRAPSYSIQVERQREKRRQERALSARKRHSVSNSDDGDEPSNHPSESDEQTQPEHPNQNDPDCDDESETSPTTTDDQPMSE